MAADTKIEWADHTPNPWVGCTKVSPACDHCYAETANYGKNKVRAAANLSRMGWKIERQADGSVGRLCPACAALEKRPQGYPVAAGWEDGA